MSVNYALTIVTSPPLTRALEPHVVVDVAATRDTAVARLEIWRAPLLVPHDAHITGINMLALYSVPDEPIAGRWRHAAQQIQVPNTVSAERLADWIEATFASDPVAAVIADAIREGRFPR